ncbi:Uma2 family endonuclease [Pirellulaceae bacterium SH449]
MWRLIIEVAETSLERDRAKAAIYHSAGVEEYWIANVDSQCIERFPFFGTSELQPPSLITAGMQTSIRIGQTDVTVDVKQIFA